MRAGGARHVHHRGLRQRTFGGNVFAGEGCEGSSAKPFGHPPEVFEQLDVVRLRDLQDESFLFRTNCDMGDFLLESCRKEGFEPRIVYRSAREDWVQTMVASRFGITVMPEFTRTDVATVARPIVDPDLFRELSLVTVAGRRYGPTAASLQRAIRTHSWHDDGAQPNSPQGSMMRFSKTIRSVAGSDAPASANVS